MVSSVVIRDGWVDALNSFFHYVVVLSLSIQLYPDFLLTSPPEWYSFRLLLSACCFEAGGSRLGNYSDAELDPPRELSELSSYVLVKDIAGKRKISWRQRCMTLINGLTDLPCLQICRVIVRKGLIIVVLGIGSDYHQKDLINLKDGKRLPARRV